MSNVNDTNRVIELCDSNKMNSNKIHSKRLMRSESFLGIHFDFHAKENDSGIGATTTEAMVEEIIDKVRPDYMQCDCKGHRGLSSYPTHVGTPAPGIVRDTLRIWRDVTARKNVSLYVHYSGVWDTQAILEHPEWARMDENGQPDPHNTSTFSPYVDNLLIPQLKELINVYDIDGVWVDGECWATCPDYGPKAIAQFRAETGIQEIPKKRADPGFQVFFDICRESFRRYLRHYTDTLHQHKQEFEVASNWAFSSMMPEPVSADVDFLSGDFLLQDSVRSARMEARCLAHQGKPWDLMAWTFSSKWGEGCFSTKSPIQLKQEASIVLSLGGGLQVYFQQKRDASISGWHLKLMTEIAGFCRERQQHCHRGVSVPQIALLLSTKDFYHRNTRLFSAWYNVLQPLQGVLDALLDNQYSVDILMDHHLEKDLRAYPLLVVPESEFIGEDMADALRAYVRNGGNLLVIGAKATAGFRDDMGIRFDGESKAPSDYWLEHNGWLAGLKTSVQPVSADPEAPEVKLLGKFFLEDDNIGVCIPAASVRKMGNGKIAGMFFDFGERYLLGKTPTARAFLKCVVHELFPDPLVRVEGSHHVDVVLSRVNGKLSINLVNTGGPHADKEVYVYDEIPASGMLTVSVRCESPPRKLLLEPAHSPLPFTYLDGVATTTIDSLEIHSVIVVEE